MAVGTAPRPAARVKATRRLAAFAAVALEACATFPAGASLAPQHEAFWSALRTHCGRAYEGRVALASGSAGDTAMAGKRLDFSGYFRRLNPAWERTLGFTREELMSRPFIEFVHPEGRQRTLAKNMEVRSGGKALSFENRYVCKDGSYRWLRWNAAPDVAQHGIYSVARDVTESKQAAEEREDLVRELRAALAEVQSLRAILPICSYCRKIRDDENYLHTVEGYIATHTTTRFSHGICPACLASDPDLAGHRP